MKFSTLLFINLFLFTGWFTTGAQSIEIKGLIRDSQTGEVITSGIITVGDMAKGIQSDGSFSISITPQVDTMLLINVHGYETLKTRIPEIKGNVWQMGELKLVRTDALRPVQSLQDIPVIELTESDFDEQATGNVSALLQASRDPFLRAAAFQFSAARFRIRGYESRYTTVLVNGVSANDPRNGDVFWSEWAGLNDVMRAQDNLVGLVYNSESVSNMGGITTFDTRAHKQRKQIRASYSISNRTYTNRLMATYSTGWLKNDWAFSFSGSRRWAKEGYIPATYFDGWSYFASADKRIAKNHIINLTVLGAPLKRGRSIANTHEQNVLAGSNYYNPYWGYQDGKKRNSRALDTHQPLAIMRYDWKINRTSNLLFSLSWQGGYYGTSSLEWQDAPDPRAEYYRRWPSSVEDPNVAMQMAEALSADESLRQVNWTAMYEANRNSLTTINDVEGIAGNSVTGLRSKYMLQDYRSDSRTLQGRMVYQKSFSNLHVLSAGIQGQQMRTEYFKNALDLLGGDFWLDVDRFAEFDFPNNPDVLQNDLDRPNRVIREGERFGYDYDIHAQNYQGWAQLFLAGSQIDGFIGGEVGYSDFYREGNVRTGRFPDNSLGKSDVLDFLTWKAKGGLTYKINGRNYITAALFMAANAPDFNNGFVSPRTRNDLVVDIPVEKVRGGEIAYRLQSPTLKFSATGYVTEIEDQVNVITFYNDLANTFGNYILSNLDRRHIGTEWGLDWKLFPALELNSAIAIGQHYYTDRALATVIQDNTGAPIYTDQTVYMKNYRVDGMPQEAYSIGLTYNSSRFWFANIQLNYFRKSFLDFSPDRRTAAAVEGVEQGSDQWHSIIDQEELPGGLMLNVFGGKSWKFNKTFLYLNVGINNILNNTELITGGFEQLRFDTESRQVGRFPNRYFYAFGLNYFVNISLRI